MPQASAALPFLRNLPSLLRTDRFGRSLRGYDSVASTNTEAAAWADKGAPEGSIVVAEYQEAGRGRLGRRWDAAAGQNLMFSAVLRPSLPPEQFGLITLAASLAVTEAITPFTSPTEPTIKWPNDVLLEGRKCCGMLLESAWSRHRADAPPVVILGIGLNVNQSQFPPDLAERATSLLLATGQPTPRTALLARLLEHLEDQYDRLTASPETLRHAYEARMHRRGQWITLQAAHTGTPTGHDQVEGRILGITATGSLRLQTDTGIRSFHAGEVTTL